MLDNILALLAVVVTIFLFICLIRYLSLRLDRHLYDDPFSDVDDERNNR